MGIIARVLWQCLPELLHVGAVLVVPAVMIAIMGIALFGDRAASFSTLSGVSVVAAACSLSTKVSISSVLRHCKQTLLQARERVCHTTWQARLSYLAL